METFCFETAKSGIDITKSEDSMLVKRIDDNSLMIVLSDGASTGVFSRDWSKHITQNFDTAWLSSENNFVYGLDIIRKSFKPEITRPTALRKYLMEGSYATVYSLLVEKTGGFFRSSRFILRSLSVGDINLFIFRPDGKMEYSFPSRSSGDFNNIPNLFRSSSKLQKDTPFEILSDTYTSSAKNIVVIATDALSEFIFRNRAENKGYEIIEKILICKDQEDFDQLINHYRQNYNMNNDDVAVCILKAK